MMSDISLQEIYYEYLDVFYSPYSTIEQAFHFVIKIQDLIEVNKDRIEDYNTLIGLMFLQKLRVELNGRIRRNEFFD